MIGGAHPLWAGHEADETNRMSTVDITGIPEFMFLLIYAYRCDTFVGG